MMVNNADVLTMNDDEKLAVRMVNTLRATPCRSRELFQRVEVDERVGREVLAKLIDERRVLVETNWILRAVDPSLPAHLRIGRCYRAHPTSPHGYTGCRLPPNHIGECRWTRLLNLCKHRGGWRPCEDILDCPFAHDAGDEDQDSR